MPIPAGMMTGDAAVDGTDLSGPVATARAKFGWTAAESSEAELWYRRFLALTHQEQQPGAPPKAVFGLDKKADEVWHAHIAGAQYAADCEAIFGPGPVLSHTPGEPPNWQQLLDAAMALYRKRWHQVPPYASICCT